MAGGYDRMAARAAQKLRVGHYVNRLIVGSPHDKTMGLRTVRERDVA